MTQLNNTPSRLPELHVPLYPFLPLAVLSTGFLTACTHLDLGDMWCSWWSRSVRLDFQVCIYWVAITGAMIHV
jgi:hypothetical protein